MRGLAAVAVLAVFLAAVIGVVFVGLPGGEQEDRGSPPGKGASEAPGPPQAPPPRQADDGPEGGVDRRDAAEPPAEEGSAPLGDPEDEPRLVGIEVIYDFDANDPRELVARSENVFVGRVEEQVSQEPLQTTIPDFSQPQTQWSVEVTEVLAGGGSEPAVVGESVVVNQQGGTEEDPEQTFVVVDAASGAVDGLLTPGESYLFSSSYDPAQSGEGSDLPWQTLTAQPGGNIPLDESQESQQVLEAFAAAVEEDPDTTLAADAPDDETALADRERTQGG